MCELDLLVFLSFLVLLCSPLCYSSDRQLSLDLVNVGRQRLDFLPMLEHSGMYRENATHTGSFAQEIITLVHLVKGPYLYWSVFFNDMQVKTTAAFTYGCA